MSVARAARLLFQKSQSALLLKRLTTQPGVIAIATILPERLWPTRSNVRRFHAGSRTSNTTTTTTTTTFKTANVSKPPLRQDGFEETKVCVIGSGNWGSAIAKIIGGNTPRLPFCQDQVNMWVYEEMVNVGTSAGKLEKLSTIVNETHENVKYLPGIKLPENVVAVPDLAQACDNATLLVFVLPHQFLPSLLPTIKNSVHWGARGISLIKGLGTCSVYMFVAWCSRLIPMAFHSLVLSFSRLSTLPQNMIPKRTHPFKFRT